MRDDAARDAREVREAAANEAREGGHLRMRPE
jgi:hypothetical protein